MCRDCNKITMSPLPYMPKNPMLALPYVPYQHIKRLYSPMEGLHMGTIFPELVQPPSLYQNICREEL